MYYAFIENNKINGTGQCRCLNENVTNLEVSEEIYNNIDHYIFQNGELILNPNYEEEQAQKERERVAMLHMTPLDFLKAVIKLGISYDTIKQLMEANPEVEMEMRYCQNVYRGHPMINQFATQFGVSQEQLDYIFKKANGEID